MPLHIDYKQAEPTAQTAMLGFNKYVGTTGIDPTLRHLIDVRASPINGCSYCIDMHTQEARRAGEAEHRLYALSVWRETSFFNLAERCVLALTEHVTSIADGGVPSILEVEMREIFSDQEIIQLLMAIIHINAWNRLGIATGMQPQVR
ncbi:carboxymuconolactone decarboxylase family protein [soil metagenome]